MSRFGSSIGNSKGHFMIASGLLPGALGGTRTPNLLIRSKIPTVQISPWLSDSPAYRVADGGSSPAPSGFVHTCR